MPRADRARHRAADRAADAAAAAALPGLPRIHRPAAVAADRRPDGQSELQHHDAGDEHRRPVRVGAGSSSRRSPSEVSEVQDVSTDMEMKSPRINLVIDRDKARGGRARTRRSSRTRSTTRSGRNGRPPIYGNTAQYRVLVELDPKYQGAADSLQKVAFRTPSRRARAARVGGAASRRRSVRSRSTTPGSCRRCRCRSV